MRKREVLVGMVMGAGLVYYLDPREGAGRRNRLSLRVRDALSELTGDEPARRPGSPREAGERRPGPSLGRYGARVGDLGGLEAANLVRSGAGVGALGPVGLLGLALALYGLTRRGLTGVAARTLGGGMVVSRIRPGGSAGQERRRTVDIQKTLRIEAPVDQVYAFWSDYANFRLFMSSVLQVEDLGAGRSHWVVAGPGGIPIEWDAVITIETPGELLAWRSEPGAMLEHAGAVRFSPEGGGTRLDLRFCYHPPGGGAGQAVTELLGADPRAKLNQDLGRLKALLESTVRSEAHGEEPGS